MPRIWKRAQRFCGPLKIPRVKACLPDVPDVIAVTDLICKALGFRREALQVPVFPDSEGRTSPLNGVVASLESLDFRGSRIVLVH